MKNPGIILQARLQSNRFPNKVLTPLLGKPVLQWVIENIVNTGLPWVIAIPKDYSDLGINSWCKEYADRTGIRIRTSFGHSTDLIFRYLTANDVVKFDPIIRICGDSPFFSVEDVNIALDLYNKREYYTLVNHVQVFGAAELEYADDNDRVSREHAGTRFMSHTIDYPEDILRIEREFKDGSPTMDGRIRLWQENQKNN